MTTASRPPASVWNESGWVEYYSARRSTTQDIYPSEWMFLKDQLTEGVSVLDVGCAVGGLASVLSEHLTRFAYTGVDLSESMINTARQRHPGHSFHVIGEADLSVLANTRFDLVVCLGVLHLSRQWRELMSAAWARVERSFLFDLRETSGPTIEDETKSYYSVDTLLGTGAPARLPYNVINSAEALDTVMAVCSGATGLRHYGYLAGASAAAVTPAGAVMMNTYKIDRA